MIDMKAVFFRRFGPPEVLEYGDLPDRMPAAGEVLVDIHAASVNAADTKMRAGQYGAKLGFPHIPGRDFSGVVAAVGKDAHDFKPDCIVNAATLTGAVRLSDADMELTSDHLIYDMRSRTATAIRDARSRQRRV